jgi:hypothetical protein
LHEDVSLLRQYVAEFLLKPETFQIKVVEKIKTHVSCAITFVRKSCRLRNNVENCGGATGAAGNMVLYWYTHENTLPRPCTHTPTHSHTHSHTHTNTHTEVCNFFCFSMAIVVSCFRLNVTLYTYCFSCIRIILLCLILFQFK